MRGGGARGERVARTWAASSARLCKRRSREEVVETKDWVPVGWRARAWRRMLDGGVYRNQSELARGEGVWTAAVSIALGMLRRTTPDGPG